METDFRSSSIPASTIGMLAPVGTPAAIIRRLNQEIIKVLDTADVKAKLFSAGAERAPSTPEELSALIKSDMIKWGRVIKDAGLKAD